MKKCYLYIRISIIISCILAGFLIINASFPNHGRVLYDESTINMDNWTYHTNYDSMEKKVTLPWLIDFEIPNTIIYMKSVIPKINSNQSLLIDSYMKNVKVYINGRNIYESHTPNPRRIIKSIGRGLYFVDIPAIYSGSTIEIEVTSPIPKSEGIIHSIYLGDRATHVINLIKKHGVENAVAIVMIFLGIISAMIYIAALLKRIRYVDFAFFGSFSLLYGVWIIGDTNLYQVIYNNPYIGYTLEGCSYYLIPIPLLCFILSSYNIKNKNILVGFIGGFSAFFIVKIVLQVLGILELHQGVIIYNLMLAGALITIFYILIGEIIRKNRDIYIFSAGCICMVICGLIDLVKFYYEPLEEIGGVYILGVVVFLASIGVTIARHIIRLGHKKIKNIELKRLAYKDITTGVFNRRKFDEDINCLNEEIGTDIDVCIIVVDVDNLKKTNDTEGHLEGDKLIIETANILQKSFEGVGRVYRIGGDEFVVICINQDKETIEECEKTRKAMVNDVNYMTCKHLAMSCGKSCYINGQDSDIYCVFDRADRLMYENKRERKKVMINEKKALEL